MKTNTLTFMQSSALTRPLRAAFKTQSISKLTYTRTFQYSALNLAEIHNESQNPTPKRKPLSRIAIGGSKTTKEKLRDADSIQFSAWKAGLLLVVVGGAMALYFRREKARLDLQREAEANRGYGKPLIGGNFNLIDTEGNQFTEQNLLGKWSLVYFGFTHCPDICPDELDKMSIVIDKLAAKDIDIQPIFITCDPARDSPEVMKHYLSEFNKKMIGLTGEYDEIKNTCKKYRVYFSTPRDVKPDQDYLVDHSIFFYLMDPEGQFVDALGRQYDEVSAVERISEHVAAYVPKELREKQKSGWLSFLY